MTDTIKMTEMEEVTDVKISLANLNKYKSEEIQIGTWIDGRKVYRRIWVSNTSSTSTVLDSTLKVDSSIIIKQTGSFNVENNATVRLWKRIA